MDRFTVPTKYWHRLDDGRVQCDLCPLSASCVTASAACASCVPAKVTRSCSPPTVARADSRVDPIEKKPLNHSCPDRRSSRSAPRGATSPAVSVRTGTSRSPRRSTPSPTRHRPRPSRELRVELGCRSVAFTYNDPTIFMEYAVDVADACHEVGVKTVAVTAGYISPEPRAEFYRHLDAANVDLKGFTEDFYKHTCGAELGAVLDTLRYLAETDVWVELTTSLIPGMNDSDGELDAMTRWVVEHLGPDVPMHFTAFHPDYRMLDRGPTPPATLSRARRIAMDNGVRYAYTGNVRDLDGGSTRCHGCGETVISRDGYVIGDYGLDESGHCAACGTAVPGVFEGPVEHWGQRRQPVVLRRSGSTGASS